MIKKLRSAKAFKAMGDTVAKTLYRTYQNKPDIFTYTAQPINSLEDFKEAFFFSLKDFHKTAIQRCQQIFYPHISFNFGIASKC